VPTARRGASLVLQNCSPKKLKKCRCTVAVTPVMVSDTSRAPPSKKRGRYVEGAKQKSNGKWTNSCMFPGREFDDLDAYRAAKKQRVAQKYR
tara:strand:+ start:177 stop:452 length:276 start_codon:yes stop_codon:yes gene_type:complete